MNAHTHTHHRRIGRSVLLGSSPSWSTVVVVGLAVAGVYALTTCTCRHRRRGAGTSDV